MKKRDLKHLARSIAFIISILCWIGTSSYSFAVDVNPEVANIGYWYGGGYGDEDIRNVLTNRLGSRAYIAPAVLHAPDLIIDVARNAIIEARANKPALIPVSLNNNHWTAPAIRTKTNGDIVVFFNDSLGGGLGSTNTESGQYIATIKQIVPNAEIIDLQVHQQDDGSSFGALAGLDPSSLTSENAKQLLATIKDAKAIRLSHLNAPEILSNLSEKIVN